MSSLEPSSTPADEGGATTRSKMPRQVPRSIRSYHSGSRNYQHYRYCMSLNIRSRTTYSFFTSGRISNRQRKEAYKRKRSGSTSSLPTARPQQDLSQPHLDHTNLTVLLHIALQLRQHHRHTHRPLLLVQYPRPAKDPLVARTLERSRALLSARKKTMVLRNSLQSALRQALLQVSFRQQMTCERNLLRRRQRSAG